MSGILERAKAHRQSKTPNEIRIPEWGTADQPAIITWTSLTVAEQDRIYAADSDRPASGGTIRVRAVILKACDAEGRKLFDGMAEHDLRHSVDGNIVGRIANAILFGAGIVDEAGTAKPAEEQIDAAKNG